MDKTNKKKLAPLHQTDTPQQFLLKVEFVGCLIAEAKTMTDDSYSMQLCGLLETAWPTRVSQEN